MAFYAFEFNIPANTLETNPVVLQKQVISGTLNHMKVIIPNGHQGLARLRVESREAPILPTQGSDPPWVRGDGSTIEMEPKLKLPGPEWIIRFIGWNSDTVNDHNFIIYMDLT